MQQRNSCLDPEGLNGCAKERIAMAQRHTHSRYERQGKKRSAAGTFFSTLLLVVAVGVFSISAYKLIGWYFAYKAGTDEYKKLNEQFIEVKPQKSETEAQQGGEEQKPILTDVTALEDPLTLQSKIAGAATAETIENKVTKVLPVLKNPVNFKQLHEVNEDVIAWIRIGALELSYPVAQAADNDYYLHRTFERKDNFAGCIFLNCDNSRFFTDQNSVIYGHNMKNGSMFGTLKKFGEQEVYDSNPYFWIFTEKLIYQYRIFSATQVPISGDPYRVRFAQEDFENFIRAIQTASLPDTKNVEVTGQDRIVTLSTCTGSDATRFIVEGRLEQMYIAG